MYNDRARPSSGSSQHPSRLQIKTTSKPFIKKSSDCPRGIKRPSCFATSKY